MANLICGACDGDWWEVRHLIQTQEGYARDALSVGAVPVAHAQRVVLVCAQCGERLDPS